MLIGIDASRSEANIKTGVERYCFELIKEMRASRPKDAKAILYSREPLPKELGPFDENWKNIILKWPPRYGWTQIRLAWEMWRRPPDVLFVPGYSLPLFAPKRSVVTIHDATFLEYPDLYPARERWAQKYFLKNSCRRASAIIVPSEYTKTQLVSYKPANIAVIPLGVRIDEKIIYSDGNRAGASSKQEASAPPLKVRGGRGRSDSKENYFIFVGRVDRKKNLEVAIKGFAEFSPTHPEYKFMIVGKSSFGFDDIKEAAEKSGAGNKIEFKGSLPDKEMFVLLKNAVALVHPCPVEGFGLPVVEAMSLGVPVIVADHGAAAEAAGDAALAVSPIEPDKWAQAMNQVTFDIFRNTLIEKGKERAKRFTWPLAAAATWKVLIGK